jgi:hypothetical protein
LISWKAVRINLKKQEWARDRTWNSGQFAAVLGDEESHSLNDDLIGVPGSSAR